jgi:hypothetical protein
VIEGCPSRAPLGASGGAGTVCAVEEAAGGSTSKGPASGPNRWGRPRRRVPRAVVYGLLAVLVLAATTGAELWPFNSWQLFSHLRQPRQTAVAVVVERPSAEERLDPTMLWGEYRSLGHGISRAHGKGQEALGELCDALYAEVVGPVPDATGLRIERTTTVRPSDPGSGNRPRVLDRQVLTSCGG